MKIALAPNAYRGSLSAQQAVACMAAGLRRSPLAPLDLIEMPLADGGDGTLETLLAGHGERITMTVRNPLGAPVSATYGVINHGNSAVIELARASGVELIPRSARNPLLATSAGTGDLIRAAVERGVQQVYIGMGGSATVEGGAGCLQALGVRLLDAHGRDVPPGGAGLSQLAHIDPKPARDWLGKVALVLLADVTNPLLGERGAARIFGPQKGATLEMVDQLERNLAQLADVIQRDLGVDVRNVPGGGAAGGFGAGLVGCVGAALVPGGATILSLLGYDQQLVGVEMILTGEGKLDAQTVGGKAVQSIAQVAQRLHIPVIALAGTLDADAETLRQIGIDAAWSILRRPCTFDDALSHAAEWLTDAAAQIGSLLALGRALV
jgi:glycerate 2-kinase